VKKSLLAIILMLTACAHPVVEGGRVAHVAEPPAPRPNYAAGSLWQSSSVGMTEDFKARRLGDTLTILISEVASASKEATTGTSRKSSHSAGIPNLLGLETSTTGIKNWMDLSRLISAANESKFDGNGSTSRKDNLSATITARVVDILANGNLVIEGRRNVRVNSEDQVIVLKGMVRQRDISPDNTVNSGMIADARIVYSGNGVISDRQNPGWLANMIDTVWPF